MSADVELAIFNLAGQQVATLAQGAREAGTYTVNWDGRDDDGRTLASGVYLYRLRVGDGGQVETRKLLMLR
jgi:flagellar hook assembly protein FlgD